MDNEQCAYCRDTFHPDADVARVSHEPICPKCAEVEFEGLGERLEFDKTAHHVRRAGEWYVEGKDLDGRTYLVGRIHPPENPNSPPTRVWQCKADECAWDVNFVDLNDPFESRKIGGTFPHRCVYCGRMIEAEYGWEQCCDFVACDACFQACDAATKQTFVGKIGYNYICRRGRWYLEAVCYSSGRDFVVGEVDSTKTNIQEPPNPREDENGQREWDCEFKTAPDVQRPDAEK